LFLVQQGAQESRAMVCNVLYMLPTILNVSRVSAMEDINLRYTASFHNSCFSY
jgi:hypothetical protein